MHQPNGCRAGLAPALSATDAGWGLQPRPKGLQTSKAFKT